MSQGSATWPSSTGGTQRQPSARPLRRHHDVVVAGAGVAGTAIAVELARAGLDVVCIEPARPPRDRVGESLDWATPSLLRRLGIHPHELIASGTATSKREVRATTMSGMTLVGRPPEWVRRPPLRLEHSTIHVDRRRFDTVLERELHRSGATLVAERVTDVVSEDDSIAAFVTEGGSSFSGRWHIDASGRAQTVARALGITSRLQGPHRLALWSRIEAAPTAAGTTLHLVDDGDDLRWVWEIPIGPRCVSVGAVMTAGQYRSAGHQGKPPEAVLAAEMRRHERFAGTQASDLETVHTRGYRCRVAERIVGPNWLMVGEAGILVDPLTSLGVTSALRDAAEAARVVLETPEPHAAETVALRMYERRARTIGRLYNDAIDSILYAPACRRAFGLRTAAKAYVILGFGVNAVYTRVDPRGVPGTVAIDLVARLMRLWTRGWVEAARLRSPGRRRRAGRIVPA